MGATHACTCRRDPIVLRISLPPGSAPEVIAVLVERAVAAYVRRHDPWGGMPRAHTPEEQRAVSLDLCREAIRMGGGR